MSTEVNNSPLLRMNLEYWSGGQQGEGETERMEVRENAIVDSRNARNPIRRLRLEEDLSGDIPGEQDEIPNTPPPRRRVLSMGALSRVMRDNDSSMSSPRRQRTTSSSRVASGRRTPRNQPLIRQFTEKRN